MTAREQTSDSEFNRLILAYDNFTNLLRESVNVIGHPEIICGNAALRKQDMQDLARSACRVVPLAKGDVPTPRRLSVVLYQMLLSSVEEQGKDGRRDNTL
jgi:hypothetical protein